ncbi:MAG: PadR family transcriptional regulator [Acidobacteriales bacterium]|nr:PadR family transcriptional regulator [Terriglobales bacterium]
MGDNKSDVLQGTLDLMVLKTLEAMSPLHGYGIARRIEQVSGNSLVLNQGTIYPALLRLEQRGWIKSEWGTSETNRRARFYSLSRMKRQRIGNASPQPWRASSRPRTKKLASEKPISGSRLWTSSAHCLTASPNSSPIHTTMATLTTTSPRILTC